jgi:guanylate kinase
MVHILADQPGVYDTIIVNDDLDTAYRELKEFLDEVGYFQVHFVLPR